MIVQPEQFNKPTMDYIKDRYMGKADDLMMIYVLMHLGNHWYLLIIDLWEKQLVYLNSFKSTENEVTQLRLSLIREVARYVEDLVNEPDFWVDQDAVRPIVFEFEPLCRDCGQQEPLSLDCGVWVCQWMMNIHLWMDYQEEEVNESTRMAIVVDLVSSENNPITENISKRAVNFWDAEMLRNHKSEIRRRGKN
ncbi:hypothetical protein PIB30_004067 [Stylosanthes scabra]|uniref:Ubiquitin-like protease family profile domain-containing protein n=1 Tax=Stylosanthes scabra TaxID=79078 RepID=A0ABU6Y0B5_9FABA|nr:hypothetical protein [Stylosanthes scabra]